MGMSHPRLEKGTKKKSVKLVTPHTLTVVFFHHSQIRCFILKPNRSLYNACIITSIICYSTVDYNFTSVSFNPLVFTKIFFFFHPFSSQCSILWLNFANEFNTFMGQNCFVDKEYFNCTCVDFLCFVLCSMKYLIKSNFFGSSKLMRNLFRWILLNTHCPGQLNIFVIFILM